MPAVIDHTSYAICQREKAFSLLKNSQDCGMVYNSQRRLPEMYSQFAVPPVIRGLQEPKVLRYLSTSKIPMIAHFIWLGTNELPGYAQQFVDKFVALHPEWLVLLWRDQDVEDTELVDQKVTEKIKSCAVFAMKADVLRYYLLWRFGGVYLDIDMEPVHCLTPLIGFLNLLNVSLAVSHESDFDLQAYTNAAIISQSQDLAMKYTSEFALESDPAKPANIATGPYCLGKGIREAAKDDWRYVFLPTNFFYPVYFRKKRILGDDEREDVYCIHHWEATWLKK